MGPQARLPRTLAVLTSLMLLWTGSTCLGQSAPNPTKSGASAGVAGGELLVELEKSLDAKRVKPGATVAARFFTEQSLGPELRIPQNSLALGHVTQVTVRSGSTAQSTLTIVFDQIRLHKGRDLSITGIVQAAAPDPVSASTAPLAIEYADRTEEIYKPNISKPMGVTTPTLNEQSRGVDGIKDLQLDPHGMFFSDKNDVKVPSGTRLLLAVTLQ